MSQRLAPSGVNSIAAFLDVVDTTDAAAVATAAVQP